MDSFQTTVDRYASIMVVLAAIANLMKFSLKRDSAALYTVAIIGSLSFIALAVYMRYFPGTVTRIAKGLVAKF